jgi:hypothetical protein
LVFEEVAIPRDARCHMTQFLAPSHLELPTVGADSPKEVELFMKTFFSEEIEDEDAILLFNIITAISQGQRVELNHNKIHFLMPRSFLRDQEVMRIDASSHILQLAKKRRDESIPHINNFLQNILSVTQNELQKLEHDTLKKPENLPSKNYLQDLQDLQDLRDKKTKLKTKLKDGVESYFASVDSIYKLGKVCETLYEEV